jgi:hypothetical protein
VTLGEQQRKFLPLVAKLIEWAYSNGYELTAGECYRSPEQAALNAQHGTGIANSLHILRLAVDLNVFKDGVYQTDKEPYRPLGDYWVTLDPLCRWGGNWTTRDDPFHFSLEWGGIQ